MTFLENVTDDKISSNFAVNLKILTVTKILYMKRGRETT